MWRAEKERLHREQAWRCLALKCACRNTSLMPTYNQFRLMVSGHTTSASLNFFTRGVDATESCVSMCSSDSMDSWLNWRLVDLVFRGDMGVRRRMIYLPDSAGVLLPSQFCVCACAPKHKAEPEFNLRSDNSIKTGAPCVCFFFPPNSGVTQGLCVLKSFGLAPLSVSHTRSSQVKKKQSQ